MSSPKHERDSDRESLTGWTLVDREGTPDKTTHSSEGKDDDKDSGESSSSPTSLEKKKEANKEKNESGCGTEEEEGEEELSEDLISMGKRVQEIKGESVKASSGSDSSDIETLDCPSPDDFYEDHTQGYGSLHSSLLSSLSGFTFVEDADDGDIESLASSDVMVLDQEGKGPDEETDLSLASSPSLPDDLPTIKPDTQYRHTPDRDLNSRLNVVVALTLACVLGLGLGHFLGWSSRSMWQENINSAQVRRLRELQDDLLSCINTQPQEEPESGGPEYLPTTAFIPVLPEVEAEGDSNVETFVESLVLPLEEAGVIIDPVQQQHHQLGDIHHTQYRPGNAMEPTFATLDVLYGSSDPAPVIPQEQEPRIHSGLLEPPLTSHTLTEDEIDPSQPEHPSPMKTVEPTFSGDGTSPSTVPQTNTLPPIELDSGLESLLGEEFVQPLLQNSAIPEEEDASSIAVENSQIIEALNLENEELRSEFTRLQQENVSPIKISGKDGKIARDLRERITQLLVDNEELRVAVTRQQFSDIPEGDSKTFNSALGMNYKLRLAVNKLTHLVPDITSLKVSANDLQKENHELQKQVGKLRYQEQPLPQELNAVTREVENLKKVVDEASRKKKAPPNFENAKIYLSYMSQVLQTLHDFKDGGFVEKLDVATDVFEGLIPGSVKPSASVHQKLNIVRDKFNQLKASLASKWEKIKDLGRPQNLAHVSQDTLSKMNRVIVNVVNKMKDIGQVSIMKRGKASFESTAATLAQSLAALGDQFDKTWNKLEAEVSMDGDVGSEPLAEDEAEEIEAGEEEEEEEVPVDDGEEAEGREPHDAGNEPSEIVNLGPNKAEKEGGRSDGTGIVGRGGSGGGGGRGGGDDKKELGGKKSKTVNAEKNEKHDGRRDRSRNRMSNKDEKKEEQKEKKAKKKEEKEKKKKEKEDNKKNKKDNSKSQKEKEDYGHKKEDDWARKSLQEDDKKHQRRQFNKYDKKQQRHSSNDDDDDDDDEEDDDDDTEDDGKFKRKYQKKKQTYKDDDEDDDSSDKFKRKFHKNEMLDDDDDVEDDDDDDDRKKGLIRHWEKPSRKNYRREYPGPKKAFIRRRGKNATRHHGDEDGEWMEKRAAGREVRRREEQKADWLFERAKHRSHRRDEEQKADWQFDRASYRRDKRVGEVEEHSQGSLGDHERFSHNKHERRQTKRRYVRFGYDDDNDDDDEFDSDDYEFYRHHHHHHNRHQHRERGAHKHHNNKGKREWVIPNFSATGKTYYS